LQAFLRFFLPAFALKKALAVPFGTIALACDIRGLSAGTYHALW